MNSFIEHLNDWGAQAMRFAWPTLWQSSLLIAVLFAVDFILRRKVRAAVRYALWLIVLVKLLLPPSLALPTGLGWWLRSAKPPATKPHTYTYVVTYGPDTTPRVPTPTRLDSAVPPIPPMSAAAWVFVGCAAASLALLAWMLWRWWQISRVVRRSVPAPAWLDGLAPELSHGLRLCLKLTDQPRSPAVCGLFRPVILIPRSLVDRLARPQLRAVLIHEVLHLRRRDVWVNCAQSLIQVVYWWHPLLWLANARLRRLREEAVDDAVMLSLREEADAYAPTLLEVARLALHRPLASLGLVGILEPQSFLHRRIHRLLDFRPPRKAGLTFVSVACVFAFGALALPMGEPPANPGVTQTTENGWPDSRYEGYGKVNLEAQFLIVDGARMRSLLPGLTENMPQIVPSNQITDLELKLQMAGARPFSANQLLQFPKFSGGQFHWQIGGCTNDTVDWQAVTKGTRTVVVGANVQFAATETDWTPLELTVIPWNDTNLLRCEIALTRGADTNSTEQYEATLLPGGALVWPVIGGSGVCQFVLLKQEDSNAAAKSQEPPGAEPASSSSKAAGEIGQTKGPATTERPLQPTGAAAASTTSPDKSAVSILVQDGKLLFEMGKYDEAGAKLKKALAIDSENQAARYYLSLVKERRLNAMSQTNGAAQPGTNGIPVLGDLPLVGRLFHTNSTGRRAIFSKLEGIRLDSVAFDGLPLSEVVRVLNDESKKRDPEKRGVDFVLSPYPGDVEPPTIDPATGLPVPGPPAAPVDISPVTIKINPPLTDLRLADVLDAIVAVADKPIKYSVTDDAVVFSPRSHESVQLYTRMIKIDPRTFARNLSKAVLENGASGKPDGEDGALSIQALARQYFKSLRVDLNPPKAVFFNDRDGKLFVRASLQDLDVIEQAVSALNPPVPQINIRARFVEITQTNKASGLEWYLKNFLSDDGGRMGSGAAQPSVAGILTDPQFRVLLHALDQDDGATILNESSVTTLAGRQVEIQVVDLGFPTITNGPASPDSLDLVANVGTNGWAIQLTATVHMYEFLGFDKPGDFVSQNELGAAGLPTATGVLPLPHFRVHEATSETTLWDGQTLVLGASGVDEAARLTNNIQAVGDLPIAGRLFPSGTSNIETHNLLIFVTPTLIDAAGNRIHSDDKPAPGK